ncbi:MAG: hypothetical protein KDB14_06550 [Planctomycetales bacterium]|nr:hypothetical protein [Planctomycetales bacterium]
MSQDCSAWTCPQNDSWDQGNGNNTNITAVTVQSGETIRGIICTGDEDWFSLTANACKPQVTITFDPNVATVEAVITDTAGATNNTNYEYETIGTPSSGTFTVRMKNKSGLTPLFKISAPTANNATQLYTAVFDCVD